MGRTVAFNGITLTIPDAYSALDVSRLLTPSSGGVGIVALVGESEGGAPGLHLFSGGASSSLVKKALVSGPGANMVKQALQSGSDNLVQGGASSVLFFKTNSSTQSTLDVINGGSGPAFTIKTQQYGLFTKYYTAQISSSGGSAFLTIRDQNGVPEVSPGVGAKAFFNITRSNAGGAIAATVQLHYVSGILHLIGMNDLGSGEVSAFDIDCTGLSLTQVAQQVNNNAGWTMTVGNLGDGSLLISHIDMMSAAASAYTPSGHDFKASVYELVQWGASLSQTVTIVAGSQNDVLGVPSSLIVTSLAGGTRGSTANSDVQAALNQLLQVRVNLIVPLFSVDGQDGSTTTVAAVNQQVHDHVESRSSILGRSECQAFVSVAGNKAAFKAMVQQMNSRWVAVTSQKVGGTDIDGNSVVYPEYGFATVCAQTKAGSPTGTPLTNRSIPVTSITQDASWSPVNDSVELIQAGCLIAGPDANNTLRIIAGYTSWLQDTNNANIYIETVESLAIFAFNHRLYMKQKFLGISNFTVQDVKDAIRQSLEAERETNRTIKNFDISKVKLISTTGGVLQYELAVVPFEGIVFILPTIIAVREAA